MGGNSAVNLYINCYRPNDKTTIADCLNRYYSKIDGNRFCRLRYDVFIDNVFSMDENFDYQSSYWDYQRQYWDGEITREDYKKQIANLFYEYVLKYTNSETPDGVKWSLYKNAPVTINVSVGAARAFSNYILDKWSW